MRKHLENIVANHYEILKQMGGESSPNLVPSDTNFNYGGN